MEELGEDICSHWDTLGNWLRVGRREGLAREAEKRRRAGAGGHIDLGLGAVIRIRLHFSWGFARNRMAATTQRIEVTLETLLESVDLAENIVMRISEAAGFSEEEMHRIGMAIREAVINAYNYGNQQDRSKKIGMTVELDPERMIVHVLDQGHGFELTEIPDPLAEENLLRTSGRGIFLMRAFMDEFGVKHRPEGGADLMLVKKLPQPVSGNGHRQTE